MLMKVFNKGQVVIPAEIRRSLDIQIGEMLDVTVNEKKHSIELKKPVYHAKNLAGSLSGLTKKPFPTERQIQDSLAKGLGNEK